MKSVAPHPRRGFTLVELLMVITIIGMLMGLLIVAVNRGLVRARQVQVTMQIDSLDQAMQNAKSQFGGYPPDCSNFNTSTASAGTTYRQARLLAFFRKAFPKMIVTTGYGDGSTAGSLQYYSQNAWGSTLTTPSNFTLGDLDNLDPAEILVLVLGGPPATVGQAITSGGSKTYAYSLAGWNKNPASPFTVNLSQNGISLYEFQTQRLGDADGDGWPEYYPPTGDVPQPPGTTATGAANPIAPYVYFDALTYERYYSFSGAATSAQPKAGNAYPTGYPVADNQLPSALQTQMTALQSLWGVAIPYVNSQAVNPAFGAGINDYINPKKFQIIAAGADNLYSTGVTTAFRFYTSGINFTEGDRDNVTNFATGKLGDEVK